jgi:hypothetical protein
MPIMPFAIDSCTTREVANSATAKSATAPKRSSHGARLKNSHHAAMTTAPATPPSTARRPSGIPKSIASGATAGATNVTTPRKTAPATPGHTRSGFGTIAPTLCEVDIS